MVSEASYAGGRLATAQGPEIPWGRLSLALLFCLALAWIAILALRHHQGRLRLDTLAKRLPGLASLPQRNIEVIESRRISPHGDVCLLQCDGQRYLVIVGPGQALLLDKNPQSGADIAP